MSFGTSLALAMLLLAPQAPATGDARLEVKALRFEGVQQVDEDRLRRVLVTRASGRLPWADEHYFDAAAFAADLKRIAAFYRDRGFPEARVLGHETQVSDDGAGVSLLVRIDEGQPLVVGSLELRGFDVLGEHEPQLRATLPIAIGRPVDVALLEAASQRAANELRNHGYPDPAVVIERSEAGPYRQAIVIAATPGVPASYGPIAVVGLTSVDEAVVRRRLEYRPGEPYDASELRDTQRRLFALGLFDFVNVAPAARPDGAAEVPTTVTVTEGKRQRTTFAVGYGSEEKARAQIDWRHVNFLGNARTLGVLARWSSLNRGIRPRLRQPQVFGTRFSSEIAAEWWHEDEPAYVLDSYGGTVTFAGEFSRGRSHGIRDLPPLWRVSASYINEYADYVVSEEALADPTLRDDLIALGLNPDTGAGAGLLSSVTLLVERMTTDDLIDATRGYRVALLLGTAGRWLQGDFPFVESGVDARHFQPFGGRAVLATRLRVSVLTAPEPIDENVPLFKRYFVGGATSLRGWGRFEVGPTSDSGLTLGGLTLLESTAELRFPIWQRLGGVGFLDAGNSWARPWQFQGDEIRADAGAGLRYRTPIGPVRFDIAWQLTPIPGLQVNGEPEERHWRVHLSVGQAF
jgi:outer membrane protein insertion porin family/translocation and assembly module TamA